MALIGTIRNNGWILIALMALALGGFILMEIISNIQRRGAGDVNTMGKVNGKEIKRSEFEYYQQLIYNNPQGNAYQIRAQVWEYFVEKNLVEQIADELGLGIAAEELNDLQFGNNLSPIIQQRYSENGQVNRDYLSQVKTALETGQIRDPRFAAAWREQEKEITKQALQDKLTDLVAKAVYTPAWQAEMVFRENNERIDYAYVRIPYDKISDDQAEPSDDDYSAYLKEFPGLHDQKEEGRILTYAVFNVTPTTQDSLNARDAVGKLVEGLRTAPNDSAFVILNDGTYDDSYKLKADLPASQADTLLKLPLGSVIGPYQDGSNWVIAKIVDRKTIPDSVRARHILLQGDAPGTEGRLDSLRDLITKGGQRFDSLAIKNSQDPGSGAKGGDLGYMAAGQTVPEFNAVLFYTGEKGKLYKVKTQFGWHLIEITDKKFIKNEVGVKAVFLSQPIEPSKETQQTIRDRAMTLFQNATNIDKFNELVLQANLQVQNSPALHPADYTVGALGAGEGSRDMVRWAFDKDRDAGDIAKEVFVFRDPNGGYFDSKYVVAALKAIIPEGEATVSTLRQLQEITPRVRNRRKGDIIAEQIKGITDLAALAQKYGVQVDTQKNASMLLQGSMGEPRVIGLAFNTAVNQVSPVVVGNSGVFVVKPLTEKPQVQPPADLTLFRRQAGSTLVSYLRRELFNSLKKEAEIADNRSKFF